MDLRNLMNDEEKGQSKNEERSMSSNASAPAYQNAQPSTPSHYRNASQQQTPLYAPPPAGGIRAPPPQSHDMTPLRTPSQTMTSVQYSFPQQTQQSPISAAASQPYRPFESQPSATPARPTSHGHTYQSSHPPASAYNGQPPLQQQHSYTSISPTPPSHLSRTPSSMRQSPMATMSHLPGQQHQHQYSQPNTPLGPPTHFPSRAPTFPETQSPHHQRSFSNASASIVSGSPAQHHPGIPNLVESPSAYARPSPQQTHSRRPSEYLSQTGSRERSISVSPKTKPPPRISSPGSRQSSNPQEMYTSRTLEQYNSVPLAGSPSHVTQQISLPQSQAGYPSHPNAASEVPQATQPSLQPAPSLFAPSAQSSLSSQTGNPAPQPQPPNIQHQSQKMGMSHLVTPASQTPPTVNGNSASQPGGVKPRDGVNIFMDKKRSATPQNRTPLAPPPTSSSQPQTNHISEAYGVNNDLQMTDAGSNGAASAANTDHETKPSLKRPASSSNSREEPPLKQSKPSAPAPKHRERPIWARLSKHNPRYELQGQVNGNTNGRAPAPAPKPVNGGGPVKTPNSMNHASGGHPSGPIDDDMMRIQACLGPWERSFKNNQPLPDTKRAVADWMFVQLAGLRDVGTDPHYGTVEIEAKVGTLFHKESGERCNFPVMNTVILNQAQSEPFRFESRMQESEHAHMNAVLNEALRASMQQPGRVKMRYEHFTDTDSFQPLSPTGLSALPPSVRSRLEASAHRTPKLRTTVRQKKAKAPYVAARIVKVNVSNLHIFSPNDPYDLRISINVEINLDRPDLHPEDLVLQPDPSEMEKEREKHDSPDRRKDRVSYTHLAYQIDLTRVDVAKQRPLYELELEVDAEVLRREMGVMEATGGKGGAFGDVVGGFWDNAVLLMRERAG